MKKRTKIILFVTGIIVAVIVLIVIVLVTVHLKKIHRHVHIERDPDIVKTSDTIEASFEEIYSDRWIFNGVGIEDEDHSSRFDVEDDEPEIYTSFECKYEYLYENVPKSNETNEHCFDENMLQNISEIYKTIAPVIRECLGSRYASYPLRITFRYPIDGGYISIICMNDCDKIKMECDIAEILLKDLPRIFPEIRELENVTGIAGYTCLKYNSIEDVAGFDDLQLVDFGVLLPEEDKEYILSIYPDCEIVEESYYKMKEPER